MKFRKYPHKTGMGMAKISVFSILGGKHTGFNTPFKSIFDLGVSLETKTGHDIPIMNPLIFFGTLFLGILIWFVKYL